MKIKIEHVVIVSTVFSILAVVGCGSDKEKIEVSYVDEDKYAQGDGNAMMDVEVVPMPPIEAQLAGRVGQVALEGFDEDEMLAVRSHYSPEEQKEFIDAPPVETPFNVKVQNALQHAGYYDGPIDGTIGESARTAIKNFQKAHHLTSDGVVGKRTWSKLSRYYYTSEE